MKLKHLWLALVLFTEISHASDPGSCDVSKLVPSSANAINAMEIEDLFEVVRYLKFSVSDGRRCALILPASKDRDGWATNGDLSLFRYTDGEDFCVENGSVWEIKSAYNSTPNHIMNLQRVDKEDPYIFSASPDRSARVASLRSSWNMTPMLCPEDVPKK